MDTGLKKAADASPAFAGREAAPGKRRISPSQAGTISALAGHLGISRGAICQWDKVPAERVIAVEAVTGVSRAELRPDLFGGAFATASPGSAP
jgi:DNA-binding transcriptional regulator YdaS (Cro superfamily)